MEKIVSGEEFQRIKLQHAQTKPQFFKTPIGLIIIVVVLIGVGFFGGVIYEKGHAKSVSSSSNVVGSGGTGRFGGGFGGERGLKVFGTVSSISPTSITIASRFNGSSTTLSITSSTTITNNGQTASASDIQTGDTVVATKSSASSSTASAILLNPNFGGGPISSHGSSTGGGSSTPGSATPDGGSLTN